MTIVGGPRRGGWTPVPQAQTANNQRLQQVPGNSNITSAAWGRPQAPEGEPVTFQVQLKKPAFMGGSATIEIFFHAPDRRVYRFDNPITVPVRGVSVSGTWASKVPADMDWRRGHFTFQAKVDGEVKTSNELRLIDDPVRAAVRRLQSDGFDRGR